MKYLFFDTETTGLPKNRDAAIRGPDNWPHIVSISWQVYDGEKFVSSESYIVKPMGWIIPQDSINIHGITNEKAHSEGQDLQLVIDKFMNEKPNYLIAHNVDFDYNVVVNALLWDLRMPYPRFPKLLCTMKESKDIMKISYGNGRSGYKPPKLSELYEFVFNKKPQMNQLHGSLYDTQILSEIVMTYEPFKRVLGLIDNEDKETNETRKKRRTTLFL